MNFIIRIKNEREAKTVNSQLERGLFISFDKLEIIKMKAFTTNKG